MELKSCLGLHSVPKSYAGLKPLCMEFIAFTECNKQQFSEANCYRWWATEKTNLSTFLLHLVKNFLYSDGL